MYKSYPKLSQGYIKTARKIAMAASLRFSDLNLPKSCKKCYSLLIPGETSRIRLQQKREPHIVTTCLTCGNQTRIPLRKKERKKIEH